MERQTDRWRDRQAERQAVGETGGETDIQYGQIDRWTDKKVYKLTSGPWIGIYIGKKILDTQER